MVTYRQIVAVLLFNSAFGIAYLPNSSVAQGRFIDEHDAAILYDRAAAEGETIDQLLYAQIWNQHILHRILDGHANQRDHGDSAELGRIINWLKTDIRNSIHNAGEIHDDFNRLADEYRNLQRQYYDVVSKYEGAVNEVNSGIRQLDDLYKNIRNLEDRISDLQSENQRLSLQNEGRNRLPVANQALQQPPRQNVSQGGSHWQGRQDPPRQ